MQALAEAVDGVIGTYCVSDYTEDWDLDGLATELATYWPSELTADSLADATTTDELYDRVMAEATAYYEQREETLTPEVMRQVERQVMLRIIDQKWREHLQEMDYLQGGINLRAMGQKDPLMEWQREGFEMFGQMMTSIAQEFVKYVMHVEVAVQPASPAEETRVRDVQYSAPGDSPGGFTAAGAAGLAAGDGAPQAAEPRVNTPVVKSEWDKTGRNEPCPCGSGKKFKVCHGR
jgi:preprotein translocase subunit SecA